MKRRCKKIIQYAFILIGAVLLATILMIMVYCLPTEPMQENVYRSTELYQYEGSYPQWATGYKMTQLDNVTDGYMLLEAIYPRSEHPVQTAMTNPFVYYEGVNPEQAAIKWVHHVSEEYGTGAYGRYWHGYLIFLKPLLLFFEVSDLRIFNMILCLGLSFCLFRLVEEELGKRVLLATAVSWLVLNPVSVIMSFQFSTTFYVMLTASIFVLKKHEWLAQKGRYGGLFLLIGIVTNFIDFLTYPMVGMAIPMIFAILLQEKEWKNSWQPVCFCLKHSVLWLIGYAGMWMGKWIIGSLITGANYFGDAINEAMVQSVGQERIYGTAVTPFGSILKNIDVIAKWPFVIMMLLLVGIVLAGALNGSWRLVWKRKFYEASLWLLALYPFVWFSVLQSHSISCYWFTYRNLCVTVMAGLVYLSLRVQKTIR